MIDFQQQGRLGLITINRPEALNAMDAAMAIAMREQLERWQDDPSVTAVAIRGTGKAFCAGGDIRAVWKMRQDALQFFHPEYELCRLIRAYPKPYVALMDGITMGGGVGISIHGSHRIATPNTIWAMPECAIGFYPDIGATWFLPRLPGQIGTYLALTGARLKAPDLLELGIATGFTSEPDSLLGQLASSSANAEDLFQGEAAPAGNPILPALRPAIDRCFAFDTVEEIVAALQAEAGEWAARTLAILDRNSPTSLKVALRQMRLGKALPFAAAMDLEQVITAHFLAGSDFYEGIRAALIDRDGKPHWQPAALADVDTETVASFFS